MVITGFLSWYELCSFIPWERGTATFMDAIIAFSIWYCQLIRISSFIDSAKSELYVTTLFGRHVFYFLFSEYAAVENNSKIRKILCKFLCASRIIKMIKVNWFVDRYCLYPHKLCMARRNILDHFWMFYQRNNVLYCGAFSLYFRS